MVRTANEGNSRVNDGQLLSLAEGMIYVH